MNRCDLGVFPIHERCIKRPCGAKLPSTTPTTIADNNQHRDGHPCQMGVCEAPTRYQLAVRSPAHRNKHSTKKPSDNTPHRPGPLPVVKLLMSIVTIFLGMGLLPGSAPPCHQQQATMVSGTAPSTQYRPTCPASTPTPYPPIKHQQSNDGVEPWSTPANNTKPTTYVTTTMNKRLKNGGVKRCSPPENWTSATVSTSDPRAWQHSDYTKLYTTLDTRTVPYE